VLDREVLARIWSTHCENVHFSQFRSIVIDGEFALARH